MSERFTKLYELQKNLYSEGSPIIVSAGSLLKDTQTGNIIVQLKFHSISATAIKALKVCIAAFDIASKEIDGVSEYQYLDLSIQNGQEFGSNKAIVMPNPVTRSFEIKSITVVFADGHIHNTTMSLSPLPQPTIIQSVLKDAELIKQYKLKTNDRATYVPQEAHGLWQCHCGEWNGCSVCSKCGGQKAAAFTALDVSSLTNEMNARLAEENQRKAEAERFAELVRKTNLKKSRKRRILTSVGTISAIFICTILLLFQNKVKQETAEKYREKGACTLSAGAIHTVALKEDGTVVAVGNNSDGQCEVEQWSDIISVSAGSSHTVGLKSDGTVMAVGDNGNGQCNVDDWKNVAAIFAADSHTFAIQNDGTVLATAYIYNTGEKHHDFESQWNHNEVRGWEQILYISGDAFHTIGLTESGTVIATGGNDYGKCNVSTWIGITQVATGTYHSVGLREDGSVVATEYIQSSEYNRNYGQTNVDEWTDIIAIAAGSEHTVGLRRDGTVVAVGNNEHGACNVNSWTNIVAIAAGDNHTVCLRSDGTVVATVYTGDYYHKQCETDRWKDIVTPRH